MEVHVDVSDFECRRPDCLLTQTWNLVETLPPPGTWNQFGKRENENKTSVELIHKAGPLVIVFPKRVM